MIGTALAVASIVSGLISSNKAGKAAADAARKLRLRKGELDLEYKRDANLDFLNTPMARSAITTLSQRYVENARKLAQSNVITGASDEKAVAGSVEAQKPFVNSISSLAGYGQARQDALLASNRSAMANLFGVEYNADMQRSANLQNAASNAFNSAGAMIGAESSGAFAGEAEDFMKKTFGNWGGKIATQLG